ncbi:MAG TPA: pyridoxamine 5'-phosphate oxidase family protein [Egibacteraceae bacterium]|nr:pyridoxamine 5'-phosphate oxidase family protein [Egibacteraceae bacterium]
MADLPEALDTAQRCVLAFRGRRGPLLSPMAFWADGSSLWMSTPAASVKAAALRARPECSAYVPDATGTGGLRITGIARIFGLHDPLGLAVHGPLVSAAMAALAARNTGTILGYVQDARFVPARFRPRNRVAVRVRIDDVTEVRAPSAGPGVAPALPGVIPTGVRRALTGRRSVVLAAGDGEQPPVVVPAVWGAGFRLDVPGRQAPPGPAVVHVGSDPHRRPTAVVGLSLAGPFDGDRLVPRRATWWEGFNLRTVDLPEQRPTSSIVLPD